MPARRIPDRTLIAGGLEDPPAQQEELDHARYCLSGDRHRLFHADGRLCARRFKGVGPMFDLLLGAAVALSLAAYLVAALLRPEKF
ncbi:K+-transporting ATPase KdpF subunit [Angulomicrobium tetraedrale]|uniref:K+-transporting ATPase KdpF subunit n=1 Tax=Ancylobacter tetraedralis TaxID=217068 RepID=A0A839Z542_9HYPH|nr:K(+)-transporting ATPase subunit F [Ancylobacter tetraedralis]MBB3770123.1 K+-transporting ATPase KdpF subunit [Ancylobacter tetraedralis]